MVWSIFYILFIITIVYNINDKSLDSGGIITLKSSKYYLEYLS